MLSFIRQYLWALDLVTVLLCSFFGAKLTTVYIAKMISVETKEVQTLIPKGPPVAPEEVHSFEEYQVILDRNIFDSTELPPTETPTIGEEKTPTGEPVRTSLNLKVLGVLVVGKGEDPRSSATVQGSAGLDTYAVSEEDGFAPNTKLTKVAPDRIVFVHNGRFEFAPFAEEEMASIFGPPPSDTTPTRPIPAGTPTEPSTTPSGTAIKQEGEGRFVIEQGEVQNALANVEQLYTEIRAIPNFSGGKVSGMRILSVKQGSLFDKLGLRRGDILEKLNGMELDVKKGFEVFGQLKNERHLTVDLIRQGAKKSFEYDIR